MRFNIKEMKKQGIFLGILAGFLALVILVSYITSLAPAVPTADETPETQTEQTGNSNKNEKNEQEIEVPQAHTHNWVKGSTVKPTCTEGGYTINTCFCGQSKTTDEKDALGHDLGEWKTAEPDENGDVYSVRSCSVCDYSEKKKVETSGDGGEPDEETPPTDEDPEGETPDGEEGGEDDEKDPENDGGNQDGNEDEDQDQNDNKDGDSQE